MICAHILENNCIPQPLLQSVDTLRGLGMKGDSSSLSETSAVKSGVLLDADSGDLWYLAAVWSNCKQVKSLLSFASRVFLTIKW